MRVTYSGVTATLALVVALSSGGAYAANTLVAKNSVGPKQIRAGAVKTTDLGKNSITTTKVAPNALTGADINERKLGQVPKAARADSAGTASLATRADVADRAGNVLIAAVKNPTSFTEPPTLLPASIGATRVGVRPGAQAAGFVRVTFDRSLKGCALVVSVDDQAESAIGSASATRAPTGSPSSDLTAEQVDVRTFTNLGQFVDADFTLVAYC